MLSQKVQEWVNKNRYSIGEPVYIYDKDLIVEACNNFKSIAYPNTAIHVATMANCNSDFLKIIKNEGFNVFVNSKLHLEAAKNVGFEAEQIIFTASSISKEMIHKIHDENILVNLDSLSQLNFWFENFPEKPVGIRCNIDNIELEPKKSRAGYFIGENSRLGLTIEEIQSIKNKDKINGLHIYVGTDITDVDYFISFYKALIDLSKDFPNLEYLDFGGGFGISEENKTALDFKLYGERLTKLMTDFSAERNNPIKLILEPGRIIGGQSACFVCEVTDIKSRGGVQYVGVNASSTQFPRPLLYPDESFHPVKLIGKNGEIKAGQETKSKVSGCSTYSRDFLSHHVELPKAEIGDLIVLENAGAYCAAMFTTFLGFDKPEEIFV